VTQFIPTGFGFCIIAGIVRKEEGTRKKPENTRQKADSGGRNGNAECFQLRYARVRKFLRIFVPRLVKPKLPMTTQSHLDLGQGRTPEGSLASLCNRETGGEN
jgi:hypothetical protein